MARGRPPLNPKTDELAQKQNDEKLKEELSDERTYEFMNTEEPGLMVKFSYGSTANPKRYSFMHGGRYSIPREVAEHVESRQTPIWGYRPDGTGQMAKQLLGWKPRFQMREVRA